MKIEKILYVLIVSIISFISCKTTVKKDVVNDKNPIVKTLEAIRRKGILFGHQDDLAYGINWSYIEGESDVKRVTGDYPAVFGWELGGIEMDSACNLDSVPFEVIRRLSVWANKQGGINTFSWHPYSPLDSVTAWSGDSIVVKHIIQGGGFQDAFKGQLDKLALFLQTLKDENGNAIPFIFRPWHEMDGGWFWWGSKACTSEEFKALFRLTIEYLRDIKGLTNMVVAYSPDRNFSSKEEYLTWYPGDDIIDILGVDDYWDFKQPEGEKDVIKKLQIVINTAKEKGKLAALTETGFENVTDSLWFTQKLGVVLSDSLINKELSYAMVWRNDPKVHYFFPYVGHPAENDAKLFAQRNDVLLLQDLNNLMK